MATIKDVARMAGVNPSTVSRVFSGKAPVKKETADRVLQVARDLDFSFNRAARKLVQGNQASPVIGIAVPTVTHPFFIEILRGLTESLEESDSSLMIFNLGRHPDNVLNRILGEGLDGLILLSSAGSPEFRVQLKNQRIPTVTVDTRVEEFSSVTVDHLAGGRMVADHLMSKGCTKPFYLGEKFDTPQQKYRWEGFAARFQEKGISDISQWKIQQGENTAQEAVRMILERSDWDGLFCYCDEMAYGAMRALKEARKNFPLSGYDDLPPSRYVGLSTVHQPCYEMGLEGTRLLRARMADSGLDPEHRVLQPEFRVRNT